MMVAIRGGARQSAAATSASLRRALRAVYRLLARSPAMSLLRLPTIERARRRATATHMSDTDVIEIVGLLAGSGIKTWLSGGWACDALLGEQTREHADLDIVVAATDRQRALAILIRHGFKSFAAFDAGLLTSAVELIDRRRRRRVGLHFVDIESDGPGGWHESVSAAVHALGLDADQLFASGAVAGHELLCLSAPVLLALRTGYEPERKDRLDVQLLCTQFSLALPPGYHSALDAR